MDTTLNYIFSISYTDGIRSLYMKTLEWMYKYFKRIGCAILNRNCGPKCNCKV